MVDSRYDELEGQGAQVGDSSVMLPYTNVLGVAGAAKSVPISVKELCLPASGG